jgi:hypothetical protein
MTTKLTAITSSLVLATGLALAGGTISGSPVHAAGPTTARASQLCSANHNAVFGSKISISHGACVSALRSRGRSTALYASLCRDMVRHGGTLAGVAVSQAPNFLDTTTATTITNILNKVTMPSSGKFMSVGECVSAFNMAKQAVLHTSGARGGTTKGSSTNGGSTNGSSTNTGTTSGNTTTGGSTSRHGHSRHGRSGKP